MNSSTSTARPGALGKGYILPLALLLAIIGGLAFYSQFWTNTRTPSGGKKDEPGVSVFRLLSNQAVWGEGERGRNWKEIEKGNHGHYDFPFENPSDQKGELTLHDVNCACSGVHVALLDESAWSLWRESRKKDTASDAPDVSSWVRLLKSGEGIKTSETTATTFELPPKCKGAVRVTWDGRGSPGSDLGLQPVLQARVAGSDAKASRLQPVRVALRMVYPVQFLYPSGGLKLGRLGPGAERTVDFFAWSATRSTAKLEFSDDPPLLTVTHQPLDAKETAALQKKLLEEEKWATDVKVAWKVSATLREEAEDRGKLIQHNMGPFVRAIPAAVDGERMDGNFPTLTGSIASAIEIGERGEVELGSFFAKDRVRKQVILWSDKAADLEIVPTAEYSALKLDPRDSQDFKATLTADSKESTETRSKWLLHVEVPAGTLSGAFPSTAALYLRLKSTPPRLIRVPVSGTLNSSGK